MFLPPAGRARIPAASMSVRRGERSLKTGMSGAGRPRLFSVYKTHNEMKRPEECL